MRTRTFTPYAIVMAMSLIMILSCKPKEEADTIIADAPEKSTRLYDISVNEEANIQMAKDFVTAAVSGDSDKVRAIAHSEYWDYGPGAKDSMNLDDFLAAWAETSAARIEQDPGIMIYNSLTVNEGDLEGDWVSMWGTYTAKQGDYTFNVPWHRVFLISEGKIVLSRSWYDRLASGLDMGVYQVAPQE